MAEDIVTKLKELMNLPADERLKRLKEIQEQNKKEIEAAHKLVQETQEEIAEDALEKEQIPIPQVKVEDIDMLVSDEERLIFATKRGITVKKKEGEDDTKKTKAPLKELENLEEALHGLPKSPHMAQDKQYQIQLSTMPARDLYNMASQLMDDVKKLNERDYQSADAQEVMSRVRDLAYAAINKGRAMEHGAYKGNETTEEMIRRTAELSKNIMQYVRG